MAKRRDRALQLAINRAGGPAALAKALGITDQAICNWRQCPPRRVLKVEAVTLVPRYKLRPDIYPQE